MERRVGLEPPPEPLEEAQENVTVEVVQAHAGLLEGDFLRLVNHANSPTVVQSRLALPAAARAAWVAVTSPTDPTWFWQTALNSVSLPVVTVMSWATR
jgi:hypothetical protein